MNNQKQSKKQLNKYVRFSGIAFQMIVIIALSSYAGSKLDDVYPNSYKLFTIILSLIGVALSMYFVIKQVAQTSNNNKP